MRETSKETTCTNRAAQLDQPHTWCTETLLGSALTCSGLEQWLGNSSRAPVQEHSAPQCKRQRKAGEVRRGGLGFPTGWWKRRTEYSLMCCPCPLLQLPPTEEAGSDATKHIIPGIDTWHSQNGHQIYTQLKPWHNALPGEALGATLLDGALRQPLSKSTKQNYPSCPHPQTSLPGALHQDHRHMRERWGHREVISHQKLCGED